MQLIDGQTAVDGQTDMLGYLMGVPGVGDVLLEVVCSGALVHGSSECMLAVEGSLGVLTHMAAADNTHMVQVWIVHIEYTCVRVALVLVLHDGTSDGCTRLHTYVYTCNHHQHNTQGIENESTFTTIAAGFCRQRPTRQPCGPCSCITLGCCMSGACCIARRCWV